jgi:CelD/BcsL family acetyltransferase involved in cellulose biosynthesis
VDHEPWAVVVERPDGGIEAAALLARRRRRGMTEIVRMGHGASDYGRLPAVDLASADRLASAVAGELQAIRGPWHLILSQLPVGDPVAEALSTNLRWAAVVAGDGSPRLRFGQDRTLRAHVSRKHHRNSLLAINRLHKAGMSPVVDRLKEPDEITEVLPEIDQIRRRRDSATGRPNRLGDPRYASFRRAIILKLAKRGELEVSTLRIGRALAGYNVALLDGASSRIWDGRFSPEWSNFYPGQLLFDATIERALENVRFTELDLMRGRRDYKVRLSSDVVPAQTLVAWSSSLARTFLESTERLKAVRAAARSVGRRAAKTTT